MQITDYPAVYSALDISVSTHDAHRISCRSRPLVAPEVPIGACQATRVQPRPLLVARSVRRYSRQRRASARRVAGRSRRRGVTCYSRRSWTGCNAVDGTGDADRDGTVIAGDTWKASAPGAMPWRRSPPAGRRPEATRRPRPASPAVPARSVTSSSCAWRTPSPCRSVVSPRHGPVTSSSCARAVPLGSQGFLDGVRRHQFQLRMRRSFRSQGLRTWPQSRVPAALVVRSRARVRSGHQVQLRIAHLLVRTAGRWAGVPVISEPSAAHCR